MILYIVETNQGSVYHPPQDEKVSPYLLAKSPSRGDIIAHALPIILYSEATSARLDLNSRFPVAGSGTERVRILSHFNGEDITGWALTEALNGGVWPETGPYSNYFPIDVEIVPEPYWPDDVLTPEYDRWIEYQKDRYTYAFLEDRETWVLDPEKRKLSLEAGRKDRIRGCMKTEFRIQLGELTSEARERLRRYLAWSAPSGRPGFSTEGDWSISLMADVILDDLLGDKYPNLASAGDCRTYCQNWISLRAYYEEAENTDEDIMEGTLRYVNVTPKDPRLVREVRLFRVVQGDPHSAVCILREKSYHCSPNKIDRFIAAAMETFPDLDRSQVRICCYLDSNCRGMFGIEFDAGTLTAAPEGWTAIDEIPRAY